MMAVRRVEIPRDANEVVLRFGERELRLTNLRKSFWKKLGVTKRDLLQYYADISPWLIPHLEDRAMVMKRYPNGAEGEFFYMKRAPEPRPDWIEICGIQHNAGLVNFPIVQDLPSLLWLINLGCIDLNPWYARCDDTDRPDFLHFDLDPGPGSDFEMVRQVAFRVRDILAQLKMPLFAKTTGSKGIHLYIPIVRGPLQKEVWTFAKAIAIELESRHPDIITAEYRKVNRPYARVLVDYNQNAWGRTLASIYSVRPAPRATVSAPVSWEELEAGVTIDDFDMFNIVDRVEEIDDLWKPVLGKKRYELRDVFAPKSPRVPRSQGPRVTPVSAQKKTKASAAPAAPAPAKAPTAKKNATSAKSTTRARTRK
jgi:bifunctional non-homologous end joining protein LigD